MKKFARTAILIALMVSIGGHWMLLQSAAWVGMLLDYSVRSESLVTGISKTFDGEHPCSLCTGIREAKDSESDDPQTQVKKVKEPLNVPVSSPRFLFVQHPKRSGITHLPRRDLGRLRGQPAVPPPRPAAQV